jgi:hypothetical protein
VEPAASDRAAAPVRARPVRDPVGRVDRLGPADDAAGEPAGARTDPVDRRQELLDLHARTAAAEATARQAALDRIAQDHWTAEEAQREFNDRMEELRLEVSQEANRISVRGQDLSAETQRRGQDMQLQSSREGDFSRIAGDIAGRNMAFQTWATSGQWAGLERSLNETRAIGGQGPVAPINPSPTPMYDPIQFAQQEAAGQGQFVLPGQPPPPPPGQVVLPSE